MGTPVGAYSPTPRAPGPWAGDGAAGSPAVPQALPQDELLDLARGGPGQLVDDPDLLGPLLPGQAGLLEVRPQRVQVGGLAPRLHAEERAAVLPETLVRCGDDRHLRHPLHVGQQLLDLGRTDVLPAPDDDVLHPVGDGQVAVVVDHADVAGAEPTLGVDELRVECRVRVAGEAVGPAAEDLAGLPHRHVVAVLVDGPDLDPRHRPAVGVDALLLRRVVQRPRDGRVFGRPVGAHERDPEAIGPLGHRIGDGRAAEPDVPHELDVLGTEPGGVEQAGEEEGRPAAGGDVLLHHGVQDGGWVPAVDHVDRVVGCRAGRAARRACRWRGPRGRPPGSAGRAWTDGPTAAAPRSRMCGACARRPWGPPWCPTCTRSARGRRGRRAPAR